MKKFVFIALVSAFVAAPALAGPHGAGDDGGTAYWDRKGGCYDGRGGEFTIWGPDLLLSNSAYAGSTSGLTWDSVGHPESFQTFCLESGEYIYEPMEVWVSQEDAAGNGYGSGSHAYKGGTGSGDDLNLRTAYLYYQFALGVLEGYVYDTSTSMQTTVTFGTDSADFYRWETAGVLQRVIWRLEDEGGDWNTTQTYYNVDLNRQEERYLADYWFSSLTVPSGFGIGNVRVLQMTTTSSCGAQQLRQDQLYLVPTPAAVLIGILGLGVAGWKLRKFA